METSGNKGQIPAQNDEKNGSVRGIISWGDRQYDIEEFRSLVQTEPNEKMKDIMVLEAVRQSLAALERKIRFGENETSLEEGNMLPGNSPSLSMTGTDKNLIGDR